MYTFNSYLTRSKVVHQTSCITGQVHQTSCIYLVCTLFSDLLEGSTFALGWVLIVFNLRTHLGISSVILLRGCTFALGLLFIWFIIPGSSICCLTLMAFPFLLVQSIQFPMEMFSNKRSIWQWY